MNYILDKVRSDKKDLYKILLKVPILDDFSEENMIKKIII